MSGWHIGIIGGAGINTPGDLAAMQEIPVASAFGEPSGPITTGTLAGVSISFIARHGAGHRLSPSHINYRANIDALKRCGVTDVLAFSAVHSLSNTIAAGDLVQVAQLIDQTVARERSFFGDGVVARVAMADPVCPRLSELAVSAAGAPVHCAVTYLAHEGPQSPTTAENQLYRQWGADVCGMTAMPEALLAREAELPYALIGTVIGDDPRALDNGAIAAKLINQLAANLPPTRDPSAIDTVLDHAIITPRDSWDRGCAARLDAILRRINTAPR